MDRRILVIVVAFLAFALSMTTEMYKPKSNKKKPGKKKHLPKKQLKKKKSQFILDADNIYVESGDTGGFGSGLVAKENLNNLQRKMLEFISEFHSHVKTQYAPDPRVARLLAIWNGRIRIEETTAVSKYDFSLTDGTLIMKLPMQWSSNEYPTVRTKILRFLASKVEKSSKVDKIKDTWGFYLRIATEKLEKSMQPPECMVSGYCGSSMCPKCRSAKFFASQMKN